MSLFEVRDLLPDFRQALNQHFMHPSKILLQRIERIGTRIGKKCEPYGEGLIQLIDMIYQHPDSNGFVIELVDDLGRLWTFGYPKR